MPMNGEIINLETTWARLPQLEVGQELPYFLAPSSYRSRQAFTNEIIRLTGRNYEENFALLPQASIPIPRGKDWCQAGQKVIKATFV